MKTRREFLCSTILSGMALSIMPTFFSKNASANENTIVKQTYFAMGTLVSFTACHSSQNKVYDAFEAAMAEVQRLEAIFSRHDTKSALSVLNAEGQLKNAPSELLYVLNESLKITINSNALYNPAVKPLLDLFEANQDVEKAAKDIDSKAIANAKERMDYKQIIVENSNIRYNQKEMGITLDSIAKGFIIDKASAMLDSLGIDNHVINAGGDIKAKGYKSNNEPWIIGVEDPKNPARTIAQFPLVNEAVATSGSYQRFYDKNASRHHIIDPTDATSPVINSITCKASSAMHADAYSTVCSLVQNSAYSKFRIV